MADGAADVGGLAGGGLGSMFGPIGTAFGSSLGKGLGAALGGDSGGPLVSSASAATYGTTLGNTGWSINFGAGNQTATPTSTSNAQYPVDRQANPLGTSLAPVQAGLGLPPWATVALLVVIGWKIFKGKLA